MSRRGKELRGVIASLREQGWKVTGGGKRHYKAVPPDPEAPVVFFASTPGQGRAQQNMVAQLRRSGYEGGWR